MTDAHPETDTDGGTDPGTRRAPAGRTRALAFGGLLLAGLGCLVTGSQPWWRAKGDGTPVTFTGIDATAGLTAALGVVLLAGTLLALALRRTGRRVLGSILTVGGLGVAVVGLLRLRPGAAAVTEKVRQTSLMDDYRLVQTPWNYAYAAAGLVAVAAGVLMVLRAGRWPQRADRFARNRPDSAVLAELADPDDDPSQWWKAQDAGMDPTSADIAEHPNTDPQEASEPDPEPHTETHRTSGRAE